MSHAEPEHNRPQEGEEPDKPFPMINKCPQCGEPMLPMCRCASPIEAPTTGEWTPKTVSDIVGRDFDGMIAISKEHNKVVIDVRTAQGRFDKQLWDGKLQDITEKHEAEIQYLREDKLTAERLAEDRLNKLIKLQNEKLDNPDTERNCALGG